MTTATDAQGWRPHDNLPNRLRLVRAELDLSQKEAADRAGITARVWQNAEDGRTIRSERAVLGAIALAFGVDREWLMWGGALNAEDPRPEGPGGGVVRHQGLEPRTRWFEETPSSEDERATIVPLFPAIPRRDQDDEEKAA